MYMYTQNVYIETPNSYPVLEKQPRFAEKWLGENAIFLTKCCVFMHLYNFEKVHTEQRRTVM